MLEKLQKIKDALLMVTDAVFHYTAAERSDKYIVWAESGEADSLEADNHKQEQTIGGTIDYFTKTDFDPNIDAIQNVMKSAEISFFLESVQYEEETGYIHYEWKFEVV